MWGCVHTTETQRIRTTTKFAGPSGGHSENAFCSSVTKVAELILPQTSHSPLTITGETLCLSIDSEKYTVVFLQHMVTCSSVFCPQSLTDRKFEKKPTDRKGGGDFIGQLAEACHSVGSKLLRVCPLTWLMWFTYCRCLRKHLKCHFLEIELSNWFFHILH